MMKNDDADDDDDNDEDEDEDEDDDDDDDDGGSGGDDQRHSNRPTFRKANNRPQTPMLTRKQQSRQ